MPAGFPGCEEISRYYRVVLKIYIKVEDGRRPIPPGMSIPSHPGGPGKTEGISELA